MIPRSRPAWHEADWRRELLQSVRDPRELLRMLGLESTWLPGAEAAALSFALRVPRGFVARMARGDPDDPLLRQVLPLAAELQAAEGYHVDPVADRAAEKAPGVLEKYQGRALLIATGGCAVHCRYCFRRHFPYSSHHAGVGRWRPALHYLRARTGVEEVIVSGGDPLSLDDERLCELLSELGSIPHLRRVRVHSRLPVVIPQRVTEGLLRALGLSGLPTVLVVHANHPHEIDADVRHALALLRASGLTLLNQAVLLRGVNDDAQTLRELSGVLFDAGVLPYYLHMLDPVQGAAHFAVPAATALRLHRQLADTLPGYLVPRLVHELPGASAKLPVAG